MAIKGSIKNHTHPDLVGSTSGFNNSCYNDIDTNVRLIRENGWTLRTITNNDIPVQLKKISYNVPGIRQMNENTDAASKLRDPVVMKWPNGVMMAIVVQKFQREEIRFTSYDDNKNFVDLPQGFLCCPAVFTQTMYWDIQQRVPDIHRRGHEASSIQVGIDYTKSTNRRVYFGCSETWGQDKSGCDIMFLCIGRWK